MSIFKKILVPIDGSETSKKAIAMALKMAVEDKAQVRLVHSIDELSYVNAHEYAGELVKYARDYGQKILQDGLSAIHAVGVKGDIKLVDFAGQRLGDTVADVRVPHKGDVAGSVIEGAFEVLSGFERVKESRDLMRAITLDEGEAEVFARSALALKYDPTDKKPAPITESQILMPRRFDDRRPDLWSVFNRTQENLTKGGLHGRSANGRRQQTRPVQGIDSDVRLNRALWMLADGLRQLKA